MRSFSLLNPQIMLMRFFVVITILVGSLFADVYRPSEMTAAFYFNLGIERFQKVKGTIPRSWSELASVEESKSCINAVERDSSDFQRLHRFLSSNKPVTIRADGVRMGDRTTKARVIAMGIGAAARTREQSEGENYRNIILGYDGGEFRYNRMSESKLAAAFQAEGFHLNDYSGNNGQWEPETPGDQVRPTSPKDSQIELQVSPHKDSKSANPDDPTNLWTRRRLWTGILIMLLVLGGGSFVWRKWTHF